MSRFDTPTPLTSDRATSSETAQKQASQQKHNPDMFEQIAEGSVQQTKNYINKANEVTHLGISGIATTLENASQKLADLTGLEKGTIFADIAKWSNDWANYYSKKVTYPEYMDNALNHFMTNVVGGVAGSAPGLVEFAAGPEWAAIRGWANAAPGREVQDAIHGFTERVIAGKVLHGIGGLGSPVGLKGGVTRAGVGGAYGVAHAAVQGETDPTKLAESGAIMGAMTTGSRPQPRIRDFSARERVQVTSPNYQRLKEAYKQGAASEATFRIGQRLLELDPQMDVDTTIRVSNEVQFAADQTAANLRGMVDIITGSEQTVLRDGLYETAIELYKGSDVFTLLHEVGHRTYERMSPEQKAIVEEAFKKTGNSESVKEWFADFNAENLLADLSWLGDQQTQNTLTKVKDSFISLVGQISEVPGAQVDPVLRTVVERATGIKLADAPPIEAAKLGAPGPSVPRELQLREPNNQVKQMPFYSAGRRAIENMDFNTRANGSKTDGTLTGPELLKKLEKTKEQFVKKEEFIDNGMREYLQNRKESFTPEEVLRVWDLMTPEVEVLDTRRANRFAFGVESFETVENMKTGEIIPLDIPSLRGLVSAPYLADTNVVENAPLHLKRVKEGYIAVNKKGETFGKPDPDFFEAILEAENWFIEQRADRGIRAMGENHPMYAELTEANGELNQDYATYVLKPKKVSLDDAEIRESGFMDSRDGTHFASFQNQLGHMRVTVRELEGTGSVERLGGGFFGKILNPGAEGLEGKYLVIEELQSDQQGFYHKNPESAIDIPYMQKAWELRLIKEALRIAVDKDLDGVVLPSSRVQAELYGSEGIYWRKNSHGAYEFYLDREPMYEAESNTFETSSMYFPSVDAYRKANNGQEYQSARVVRVDGNLPAKDLQTLTKAIVGKFGKSKHTAEKLAKQAFKKASQKDSGEHFPRHEGMKEAYDNRIPKQVKKYLKQLDPEMEFVSLEAPMGHAENSVRDYGIRLTEKMKQKIREGQPNYQVKSVKMHKGFVENPEADHINLRYIRSSNGANAAIMRLKETSKYAIPDNERTEITKFQKQGLADDLGITLGELNSGHQMFDKTAEDIIAYRQLLARSGDDLLKLALEAQSAPTAKNLANFLEQLRLHNGVRSFTSGKLKHAQRHFRAAGGLAEKGNEAEAESMRQSLLATAGGEPGVTKRLTKFFSTLTDAEGQADLASINRLSREVQRASSWDVIMEVWINGLLSSFRTHDANIISNTAFLTYLTAERAVESAYSKTLGSGEISMSEPLYMMYGMTTGLKEAFKLAGKALEKGQSTGQVSKVEAPFRAISTERLGLREDTPLGKTVDTLGELVRGPGRMLVTEDEFFKAIAVRAQKHALAARMVHQKKVNPLSEEGRRMMEEIMNTNSEDLGVKAREFGHYATFTNDMGDVGQSVHKLFQQIPPMKVVVPFMRTVTNIAKIPVVRGPFAPVLKEVREDIAAGGARRDRAISRIALGSAVSALVAQLVVEGVITGDGPPDTAEKAKMREAGWKPNSIKIGDEYIAYERIEPFNRFFTPVANIVEAWAHLEKIPEEEKVFVPGYLAAVYGKALADPTYLANLTKLFAAIDRPMSRAAAGQFMMNLAGSAVPAIVADVNRTWFDEKMRVSEDFTSRLKSRIPGLSSDLPPRQNHWGDDVSYAETLGPSFMSPVFTSKVSEDPVRLMMDRNDISIGMPSHHVNYMGESIRLTPDQYYEYVRNARRPAKRKIDQMYQQGMFSQLNREGKEKMVRKVVRLYQATARKQLVKKYEAELSRKARSMK